MLCLAALHTPHLVLLRISMSESTCRFMQLASLRLDQLPSRPLSPLRGQESSPSFPHVPHSVLLLQPEAGCSSIQVSPFQHSLRSELACNLVLACFTLRLGQLVARSLSPLRGQESSAAFPHVPHSVLQPEVGYSSIQVSW